MPESENVKLLGPLSYCKYIFRRYALAVLLLVRIFSDSVMNRLVKNDTVRTEMPIIMPSDLHRSIARR